MIACAAVWLAIAAQAAAPAAVQAWIGTFEFPPEQIVITWRGDRLQLQMDRIGLPVDGQWHVTNPTFGVRRRATLLPPGKAIRLEEQHNYQALEPGDESGWESELRLDTATGGLVKIVQQPDGGERIVRRYRRCGGETR